MRCRICHGKELPVRHLPIYAFGSEGIEVCRICDVAIAEFVRNMTNAAGRARKDGYKSATEIHRAKQAKEQP